MNNKKGYKMNTPRQLDLFNNDYQPILVGSSRYDRKIKDLFYIVEELVKIRDSINFPYHNLYAKFNDVLEDIQNHNFLLDIHAKNYLLDINHLIDNQQYYPRVENN